MRFFATADTHFGHGRVIEYANRPFKDSFHMNQSLIDNWNMRVTNDDQVFILGDFCFKTDKLTSDQLGGVGKEKADYWLKQLKGHKILVRGNHDRNNSAKTIIDSIHVSYAGRRINMCHKPEHSHPGFEVNLIGHVHQYWKIRTFKQHYDILSKLVEEQIVRDRPELVTFLENNKENRNSESVLLNVGVDCQQYRPITLDEALGQIQKYKKTGSC